MHVLDIGGVGISGYAPGAHDVYQEGLGSRRCGSSATVGSTSSGRQFIAANVRVPGPGPQRHPLDDRRQQHR